MHGVLFSMHIRDLISKHLSERDEKKGQAVTNRNEQSRTTVTEFRDLT